MTVVAEHVKPRWRDEGAEPRDEIEGVEQDGVGAVFPRGLEGETDAAIGVELEAVLVGSAKAAVALNDPHDAERAKHLCDLARMLGRPSKVFLLNRQVQESRRF